jgi:hypothetical protein
LCVCDQSHPHPPPHLKLLWFLRGSLSLSLRGGPRHNGVSGTASCGPCTSTLAPL